MFDLEKAKAVIKNLENFTFASGQITVHHIQTAMLGGATLDSALAEIERLRAEIKGLELYLKEEKAQNLLNFQRHDEGETRSWDDLPELDRMARIEFAGTCLEAEGKIGGGDKE